MAAPKIPPDLAFHLASPARARAALEKLPARLRAQIRWFPGELEAITGELLQSPSDPHALDEACQRYADLSARSFELLKRLDADDAGLVSTIFEEAVAARVPASESCGDPLLADAVDSILSFVAELTALLVGPILQMIRETPDLEDLSSDGPQSAVELSVVAMALVQGLEEGVDPETLFELAEIGLDAKIQVNAALAHHGVHVEPLTEESGVQRAVRYGRYLDHLTSASADPVGDDATLKSARWVDGVR